MIRRCHECSPFQISPFSQKGTRGVIQLNCSSIQFPALLFTPASLISCLSQVKALLKQSRVILRICCKQLFRQALFLSVYRWAFNLIMDQSIWGLLRVSMDPWGYNYAGTLFLSIYHCKIQPPSVWIQVIIRNRQEDLSTYIIMDDVFTYLHFWGWLIPTFREFSSPKKWNH